MAEETKEKQDYTEQYAGIIMLRKGKIEDDEVWFGTVGNQLVSDGVFETKDELIENLNSITLTKICKIVAGAFERAITYKEGKKFYRDWETDRKSTRLNSSHSAKSRMPSSA